MNTAAEIKIKPKHCLCLNIPGCHSFGKNNVNLHIRIRPNFKGEMIIYLMDEQAAVDYEKIMNADFQLIKLDQATREMKSVLMNYPREFSLELIENFPYIIKEV